MWRHRVYCTEHYIVLCYIWSICTLYRMLYSLQLSLKYMWKPRVYCTECYIVLNNYLSTICEKSECTVQCYIVIYYIYMYLMYKVLYSPQLILKYMWKPRKEVSYLEIEKIMETSVPRKMKFLLIFKTYFLLTFFISHPLKQDLHFYETFKLIFMFFFKLQVFLYKFFFLA